MGHRALVAYRRDDGRYSLHYAHWGGDLGRRIGPDAPFGGRERRSPSPDALGRSGVDVDPEGGHLADRDRPPTAVDPRPRIAAADPETVLGAVDPSIEWLVAVTPAYRTRTYAVCPIAFDAAVPDAGTDGAAPREPGEASADDYRLVGPEGDPGVFREWFVDRRSRLWAAVADGALDRDRARSALLAALARRGTVHAPDDPAVLVDP